jgi:hypothetical protein
MACSTEVERHHPRGRRQPMERLMTRQIERAGVRPRALLAGFLGILLAGCTVVGPSAVRNGRLAYTQAITETNNQQMLMAVVQSRYDETATLLTVVSVTANVTVRTNTGVELGFGDSDNYRGSLVPFSAGVCTRKTRRFPTSR